MMAVLVPAWALHHRRHSEGQSPCGGSVVSEWLAVSLDISNAFNNLPWSCIGEAQCNHRLPLLTWLEDVLLTQSV